MHKQREKYLRSRAAKGSWQLSGSDRADCRAAVIIPALAEAESLPRSLASLLANPAEYLQQTLIVIVVNQRPDASDAQKSDNQQTLSWLQSHPCPQLCLAWIDASSPGLELPGKEGVGLARKIGFDRALRRLDWRGRPLLISLDADTLVDANYLPAIFAHFATSSNGGATIPFRHQPGETAAQEAAIRRYELYLRSYLFGLQQAGSPYAYHSLGSAFACRADAYLAAGGMNRRLAGEDFYFLQQLAKNSGVRMLAGTIVQPSPRFSRRVPFGTGNAVQEQLEQGRELFNFSSLAAFKILRQWLARVELGWDAPAENLFQQAGRLSAVLAAWLTELNFSASWQKLQANHRKQPQRLAAFHGWFDGLRTRQLLARLDAGKVLNPAEEIRALLDWGGYPGYMCEADQLACLDALQGVKRQPGH